MRDINLIPKSRFCFRDYVKFAVISGLIISFLIFVIFFGVIDPLWKKRDAEQAFDIHTTRMEKYKDIIVENTALTSRLDELNSRKEALSELFAKRLQKSVLMQSIDTAVSDKVYIDSIVYGGGTITIQGSAPSPIEVADLSIGLTETGLFASVRITGIVRAYEGGRHSFVIVGGLMEAE